jgi:hypothetical protein
VRCCQHVPYGTCGLRKGEGVGWHGKLLGTLAGLLAVAVTGSTAAQDQVREAQWLSRKRLLCGAVSMCFSSCNLLSVGLGRGCVVWHGRLLGALAGLLAVR